MRVKGFILITSVIVALTSCSSNRNISETKVKVKKELSESSEQQYYYVFIEANRKKLLGDLNGALALYYQCLEINPQSSAAMAEISKINEVIQNYEVAIKYARSAVENDAENKWYRLQLAKLYLGTKNYNSAIEQYEEIYKRNKEDLEIPYNLAALYRHVGNPKRSIELYDEIEKRAGIHESLSIAKQQLYYGIGNKTKAYNEIEKLIKNYPGEAKYYGILAEMYTADNLFLKAEENYNKLFELDSTNALGQLSIIDFYRKKVDYDNAFIMIEKVLLSDEIEYEQKVLVFVAIMNNQSEFSIYNARIKECLDLLKSLYPNKKDTYTLFADYYIKMNLFDNAQIEIEYLVKNFNANVVIWEQLLSIYNYKTDFESLYEKSKVAIDSFPDHALFYLFNGVSANQIDKYYDAIDILQKGLKKTENNPELEVDFYTNLGDAYNSTKEYKQSDYYFEIVIKRDPDNLYIKNNYSYYLSLRGEKLDYAETLSKSTIEKEPNNSTFLDTYAWILFKLERYQDALYYIKRSFEYGGSESQVIVEHYGDILFKVGNIDEAIVLWKLSVEMGNTSEELKLKIENKEM